MLRFFLLIHLTLIIVISNSQPLQKDTLCKFVKNLNDSNLAYTTCYKSIPKEVLNSIKRIENEKIKINDSDCLNFSDVSTSQDYGFIYFTKKENLDYLMLKQGGFAPAYILKIFIGEADKIAFIKGFKVPFPYSLEELSNLKWNCEIFSITK